MVDWTWLVVVGAVGLSGWAMAAIVWTEKRWEYDRGYADAVTGRHERRFRLGEERRAG